MAGGVSFQVIAPPLWVDDQLISYWWSVEAYAALRASTLPQFRIAHLQVAANHADRCRFAQGCDLGGTIHL